MRVATALNIADDEVLALGEKFENAQPQTVLRWAIDEFGSEVALATGFGTEGCVLVDMIAKIDATARIFYLDTDLLFPQTYELCNQLAARYGVSFERRTSQRSLEQQALRHGE
ncbi:MAG TPA: phosphoadenosine phosphosulfate reductase family protein, partial [Pyrinomonadaceae bacterium]|nr:phosphoadenosine phosphosulfate reductase family protein [Pyrinomonadaceae bacterium]